MALLSVIRRWHFRDGMPIREIERRTGLSRNTIRKYLRSGAVEPRFKVPARPSKLGPFAEKLIGWFRIEADGLIGIRLVATLPGRKKAQLNGVDNVVTLDPPLSSIGQLGVCKSTEIK